MPSPMMIMGILLAISLAGNGILAKLYVGAKQDVARVEQAYESFKAQVKVEGETAKKEALAKEMSDKLAKDTANAENAVTVKHLNDTITSLRKLRADRASSGYLSPAAPGSTSPQTACLSRADAERAIRDFVEGAGGLAEEGDRAITDLNTAKSWAQR